MIALHFPDIRLTTAKLFVQEDFDSFLVSELSLTTLCTFQIDGRIAADYFSTDEFAALSDHEFVSWKLLRPFVYQLIRGNRLPGQFRIVFRLAGYNVEKFLKQTGLPYTASDIGGLFMNLRYTDKRLSCYTGTSLNIFDLSKNLDREWDQMVQNFLHQRKIPFEKE